MTEDSEELDLKILGTFALQNVLDKARENF